MPLTNGLPYEGYVDEGHVFVHGAKMLRDNTTDPGWYDYPTFPLTVAAGIERFVSVVNGGGQARSDVEWNVQPNHYDEIRPPQSLVVGRLFGGSCWWPPWLW